MNKRMRMKNRVGELAHFAQQRLGLERVPKRMLGWEEEANERTPKVNILQKVVFVDLKTRKPRSGSRKRPKSGVR
jgi:hypothetical protein